MQYRGASSLPQTVKNLPAMWVTRVDPWAGKISWRREGQPTPVFLPVEFHGEKSLVGYSLWVCKELDTTEWLSTPKQPWLYKLSQLNAVYDNQLIKRAGALGRPRGLGCSGRREGGLGWGTHVNPWLIHVNVWQKPLQYYKVISLQLIKINGKK